MNFEECSTERLMEIRLAIQEGRWPFDSHKAIVERVLKKRVNFGALIVYREKEYRRGRNSNSV